MSLAVSAWGRFAVIALTITATIGVAAADESSEPAPTQPEISYKDQVKLVVDKSVNRLRSCYVSNTAPASNTGANEASENDILPERLMVVFRIGKHGIIRSVEFDGSENMSITLESCLVGRLLGLKFPAPPEAKPAAVRLVLNFAKSD